MIISSGKWPIQKQSVMGLLFFLVFVFGAHVAIPLLGEKDIYPFSTWQLFDGVPCKECYYDVMISVENRTMLLSDFHGMDDKYVSNYLAQQVGNGDCRDAEKKQSLSNSLMPQGVRALSVHRMKVFLSDYVLLTPEEKITKLDMVCTL